MRCLGSCVAVMPPDGFRVAARNNSTIWRRVLARHQGPSAEDGPKNKQDVALFLAETLSPRSFEQQTVAIRRYRESADPRQER